MALNGRCDKGHPIIIPDTIIGELPEGMPQNVALCDICREEWQRKQNAKREIKIGDLQRVRLAHGDVLVVRYKLALRAEDQARVLSILKGTFPHNKMLVMGGDLEMFVIEASD